MENPFTNNLFFVDLSQERVFCRVCKKSCRSLKLAGFVLHWCASHSCSNIAEVRQHPDGTWDVLGIVETWQDETISKITHTLLISIKS